MGDGNRSTQNNFSTQVQSGHETTAPWSVQTPYLQSAFSRAEDAYNKTMATGPYQGDYVAQGDARNSTAFQQAFDFGTDPTNNGYNQNTMDKANGWVNDGTYWMKAGAEGLMGLAGDQTDNIIKAAGSYADNPYIAAAIRAAMADANRQASENDIPNLYRAAAGSNTLNSDRAALSQGVVERGLADLAGNLSGNMRSDAWSKGLDTASGELNNRRSSYGAVNRMGSDAAQLGLTGLSQGIANQSRLNQMSAAGAEGLRGLRQLGLDNAMAKYEGNSNFPWTALQNYYNIIGNKSWGGTRDWNTTTAGTSNTQTQEQPAVASQIGGGLGAMGSLLGRKSDGASGLMAFL